MIKLNQNRIGGRVILSFLLVLGLFSFFSAPTQATPCNDCESSLTAEDHKAPDGFDMAKCPPPDIDFCACPTEGCDSLLVYFTDLSVGVIDTWEWDFGDPTSGTDNVSNEENPTHMYRASGNYTVTMTVTNASGTYTVRKDHYITIHTTPTADFSYTISRECNKAKVHFTDLSTGALTWYWDFGDGTTSDERNPYHIYTKSGTYRVQLVVSNDCGQARKKIDLVIDFIDPPTADFIYDMNPGCDSTVVCFTDQSTGALTWYWNFGDGTASYEQNPCHAYTAEGTYLVTLVVSNACGQDRKKTEIEVEMGKSPVADFTSDQTEACEPAMVSFTDLSTGAETWDWDFGDGSPHSTDQNPSHQYTAPGVYPVTLTVTNDCGDDSITKREYITILPLPIAEFRSNQNEFCEEPTVQFTDMSQYADSWDWDFGDGSPHSSDQNPSHTYTAIGFYTVTLTVSNSCGSDSETKIDFIIYVNPPTADFEGAPNNICQGATVQFTNLSTHAVTSHWYFGDGDDSFDANPSHIYNVPGVYDVKLVVSNICGADSTVKQQYITVRPLPVADYSADVFDGCVPLTVVFSDSSQHADSWSWNFGDGSPLSTERNPVHIYDQPGYYDVSLTVTNDCGKDEELRIEYIKVYDDPTADFTADPTETCTGKTIQFTSHSTYAKTYDWDFGDGTGSQSANPTHSYNVAGTYTIRLIVANDCGPDTLTKVEYVTIEEGPFADLDAFEYSGCVGESMSFTNRSLNADSYKWIFGDGSTSPDENPNHSYSDPGTYYVWLIAYNDCGPDTSDNAAVVTIYGDPIADFKADHTEVCALDTVWFTDLSTDAFTYEWDFGDNSPGSVTSDPFHLYQSPGEYTVSLKVTNMCGDDTEVKDLYITVLKKPTAAFKADITEICQGQSVHFTDQSLDTDGWEWTFGDGGYSFAQNPTYQYNTPGIFPVTLIAHNQCGDDYETKDQYILVHPKPIADFSADPTYGCVGDTISFTDLSQFADDIEWNFGDGSPVSTERYPTHVYTSAGSYTIELKASNSCGDDTETKTKYIVIYDPPTAGFYADGTEFCVGEDIQFTSTSTYVQYHRWQFGDGEEESIPNPVHSYNTPGIYTVTLTVTNPCGSDTEEKIEYITVKPRPIAAFTSNGLGGCSGLEVKFTNESQYATSYRWNFGDGSPTTSTTDPAHTFTTTGRYIVRLTAFNDCGADTTSEDFIVYVDEKPIAGFEYDKETTCFGTEVTFFDASTYANKYKYYFGDGDSSMSANPVHNYATPGTYTVTQIVSNYCGADTTSQDIKTDILPTPIADFDVEVDRECVDNDVYFMNRSTDADSYDWDFGDGSPHSTDTNPIHAYSSAGLYTVTLIATNNCGSDTAIKIDYITIYDGPTADFSASPDTGLAPLDVQFTDLSTSGFGIQSWDWNFGDGSPANLTQNPAHTYTTAGTFTVTLVVEDQCGVDTAIGYVHVVDTCIIDFSSEQAGNCAPDTVWFYGFDEGSCDISKWLWDFGDPTSGTNNIDSGQQVEHIYNNSGVYSVTLTAIDGVDTFVVTKDQYVTVHGMPTADFTADPEMGQAPLEVHFRDQSTSLLPIIDWAWDFGDGLNSPNQHPYHVYANEGTYDIMLVVTNECGPDTAYGQIMVLPDLSITKQVDKANVEPNDTLEYTLTISNNSLETIENIYVFDTIPDSTAFVADSITGGGNYVSQSNMVEWSIGTLASKSSIDLSFKALVNNIAIEDLPVFVYNQGYATINDEGGVSKIAASRTFPSNRVQTVVNKTASLVSLTKSVSTSFANPGDQLTYTITIDNQGFSNLDNVVIFDAIPDSTTYVDLSISSGGVYDPITDSMSWSLGTVAAGSSASVSFVVTIDPTVNDGDNIPNTAMTEYNENGQPKAIQSNKVVTAVALEPLVITKKVSRPSGMIGDLFRFTLTIDNYSDQDFTDLYVLDTMPTGIYYIDGSSLMNRASTADPTGDNPLEWTAGNLPAGARLVIEYSALVGPAAHQGASINIARARALQGGIPIYSNRAIAPIYILGQSLFGSIRGQVMVDCDGDGIPDTDSVPSGIDIYLDDGSQSRSNEKGIFYFNAVRAGERVVALDERDLSGYYVPDGADASVFAHVHEVGESYIVFRICPEYPILDINKQASIIPKVKVVKTARINPEEIKDSLGLKVDYEIDIKSNGLADPSQIRVVDSLPEKTRLLLEKESSLKPVESDGRLIYNVTAAEERLEHSVFYSIRDLDPGIRRYLANKVHLEGDLRQSDNRTESVSSTPATVEVGPLMLTPPTEVTINVTPALFITSMADLQEQAIPELQAVADSIEKYADADVKVEGHTDYRPIHTEQFPSNWELGEARAKAVVDWLVENRGVDRNRMDYESFAATRPVVTEGSTSIQLQPNRRTEVILKAGKGSFLDPSILPGQEWISSSSMALEPVKFDTLFELPSKTIEIDLDDSWEVILSVTNSGSMNAESAELSDIIPNGVEYIENSARVNGEEVIATLESGKIVYVIKLLKPTETIELRYRIRAIEGSTLSGGGSAEVELMTETNQSVIQKSNEVMFE